ncbi:hypothetical protein GCM10010405_50230 [Streptomyces macrosporus]|uniref:Uncharacterized protein n=2 Tax=Streptomyces macrosporus TaxID=44032 RepID=A0ABN3KHA8_9ACTN
MPRSTVTALVRNPIKVPAAVLRSRVAKDAEVPAPRQENAVLRRRIARVRHESADRIRPAVLSRLIPQERRRRVSAVTPTTPPARRPRPAAREWAFTEHRHPERPPTAPIARQPIPRPARENGTRGRCRTRGELARLGCSIAPSTAREIPRSSGVGPAPQRSGHRHRPPGPPNPATPPPRRPDQPVPENRLTERPRRSSQHRIASSSDTGRRPAGANRRTAP